MKGPDITIDEVGSVENDWLGFIRVLVVGKCNKPYRVSSVIWCPLLQSNTSLNGTDIRHS
jgi:hypothetical protein